MTDFSLTTDTPQLSDDEPVAERSNRYAVPLHRGVPPSLWPELAELANTQSLRQLARHFGTSHEAVRRALKRL